MAEYTCCSSVAFERPNENTFTLHFTPGVGAAGTAAQSDVGVPLGPLTFMDAVSSMPWNLVPFVRHHGRLLHAE